MVEFKNLRVKEILSVQKFRAKNAKWRRVLSKSSSLQIMLQGKAIHDFGDRKLNVTDNCIYFLNQYEDHDVEIFSNGNDDISSMSIFFTTYEPISTKSFCIKLKSITEIKMLFEKIKTNKALSSRGDGKLLSEFYRLCAIYEDLRAKEYSPKDPRIIKASEYIDLNFNNKNCLDIASKESMLSRRRFNELFKKQLNITPNRYLINKRIEYATQLLTLNNQPISIAEISEICGFGDIYYFNKVFKAETGLTPGKYRKLYG